MINTEKCIYYENYRYDKSIIHTIFLKFIVMIRLVLEYKLASENNTPTSYCINALIPPHYFVLHYICLLPSFACNVSLMRTGVSSAFFTSVSLMIKT